MPTRPKRLCKAPGCRNLTDSTYCPEHAKARQQAADTRRGSSTARGYGYRWQKASKAFLADNPLCVECLSREDVVPSTVTDHIVPHKGNYDLFWNRENWQALCKPCHDRKTGRESQG